MAEDEQENGRAGEQRVASRAQSGQSAGFEPTTVGTIPNKEHASGHSADSRAPESRQPSFYRPLGAPISPSDASRAVELGREYEQAAIGRVLSKLDRLEASLRTLERQFAELRAQSAGLWPMRSVGLSPSKQSEAQQVSSSDAREDGE